MDPGEVCVLCPLHWALYSVSYSLTFVSLSLDYSLYYKCVLGIHTTGHYRTQDTGLIWGHLVLLPVSYVLQTPVFFTQCPYGYLWWQQQQQQQSPSKPLSLHVTFHRESHKISSLYLCTQSQAHPPRCPVTDWALHYLHCTRLYLTQHCTTLHWNDMFWTTFYWNEVNYNAMPWTVLMSIEKYSRVAWCSKSFCGANTLPPPSSPSPSSPSPSLPLSPRSKPLPIEQCSSHCNTVQWTPHWTLYCTVQCTVLYYSLHSSAPYSELCSTLHLPIILFTLTVMVPPVLCIITPSYTTVQCSAAGFSAVQGHRIQCSEVQCSALQWSK